MKQPAGAQMEVVGNTQKMRVAVAHMLCLRQVGHWHGRRTRRPTRRSQQAMDGRPGWLVPSGHAKVDDHRQRSTVCPFMHLRPEHDVLRLQVPVQDAGVMHMGERREQLLEDMREQAVVVVRGGSAELLCERAAEQDLLRDDKLPAHGVLHDAIERDDVGVVK